MITRVYKRLREIIYHLSELQGDQLKDDIELDENYFGGKRKGQRDRGVSRKNVIFKLLESVGRVYIQVVEQVNS